MFAVPNETPTGGWTAKSWLAHLPVYDRMPVPFVAVWEQERGGPSMQWENGTVRPVGPNAHLAVKEDGIWMLRTPWRIGEGRPDFGSTHSERQRICMRDLVCQVCGRSRGHYFGDPLWTIPNEPELMQAYSEHGLSANPPVCAWCYTIVGRICPHIRRGGVLVLHCKTKPRIVAVDGDVFTTRHGHERGMIPYDSPLRSMILARQFIVQLVDPDEVSDVRIDGLRDLYDDAIPADWP